MPVKGWTSNIDESSLMREWISVLPPYKALSWYGVLLLHESGRWDRGCNTRLLRQVRGREGLQFRCRSRAIDRGWYASWLRRMNREKELVWGFWYFWSLLVCMIDWLTWSVTLVLAVVWMGYLGLRWSSLVRVGRSGDREILDDGAVSCVGHIPRGIESV